MVNGLDAEKGQYDELVSAARQLLNGLVGRSFLDGEPVGRIYAAYRLQLANEKLQSAELLLPLAPEGNILRALTCSQMNDFRCVRASFDAQRALTLPVSFYGAVFYKGVDPKNIDKQERTYAKVEFEKGTMRVAEISFVKPKKRQVQVSAVVAGEDLPRASGCGRRTPVCEVPGVHRPGPRGEASGERRTESCTWSWTTRASNTARWASSR